MPEAFESGCFLYHATYHPQWEAWVGSTREWVHLGTLGAALDRAATLSWAERGRPWQPPWWLHRVSLREGTRLSPEVFPDWGLGEPPRGHWEGVRYRNSAEDEGSVSLFVGAASVRVEATARLLVEVEAAGPGGAFRWRARW